MEVLQKLTDHEKIATTMKYVPVGDARKREALQMLEAQEDRPFIQAS